MNTLKIVISVTVKTILVVCQLLDLEIHGTDDTAHCILRRTKSVLFHMNEHITISIWSNKKIKYLTIDDVYSASYEWLIYWMDWTDIYW